MDGSLHGELADVGTGDKSLFARSSKDDGLHFVVGADLFDAVGEFLHHLAVERVELGRAIEGHRRDAFAFFVQQSFVGHDSTPL